MDRVQDSGGGIRSNGSPFSFDQNLNRHDPVVIDEKVETVSTCRG